MELNSKKLQQTSKLVYTSISIILCLFLVLLSNKIINDLDNVAKRPLVESFENHQAVADVQLKLYIVNKEIDSLTAKTNAINKTIEIAEDNYTNEKKSFDNWIETRKTLGSPEKDFEVIERAKKLDAYYKIKQDWKNNLSAYNSQIDSKNTIQQNFQLLLDEEKTKSEVKFAAANKQYELKLFLIRLLFVMPILSLGILFFIKFRQHKFWPLYFGFTLFSIYSFFFGLVPYFPSYGGYVRYAVGVVLSVSLGYYAIKNIRKFIEQKQAELKISTEERAKNVQLDVAEKALENHFCPSCGKDFIIKKWEFPGKNTENELFKTVTDFCRHCGLELFSNCKKCGNKNFSHLPFCASCGTKSGI